MTLTLFTPKTDNTFLTSQKGGSILALAIVVGKLTLGGKQKWGAC